MPKISNSSTSVIWNYYNKWNYVMEWRPKTSNHKPWHIAKNYYQSSLESTEQQGDPKLPQKWPLYMKRLEQCCTNNTVLSYVKGTEIKVNQIVPTNNTPVTLSDEYNKYVCFESTFIPVEKISKRQAKTTRNAKICLLIGWPLKK